MNQKKSTRWQTSDKTPTDIIHHTRQHKTPKLQQTDLDVLVKQTHRNFYDTFDRVNKSKRSRVLDAEFQKFNVPKVATNLKIDYSSSNITLGTDDAMIKLSELDKYEKALARVKEGNKLLYVLKNRIDYINQSIWEYFLYTKILYRGMKISELCTIARMNGAVGFHHRTKYAAINDFVSCTTDANIATLIIAEKKESGLVVKMDVSQMKRSDYAPVTYEVRRDIRVTCR